MLEKSHTLSFRISRIVLLAVGLLLLLTLLHPARVPALLLVAPFIVMFGVFYWTVLELLHFSRPRDTESNMSKHIYRPRLLAGIIAGFPVLLLVLQSVIELNRWDILIALGIFLLAYVLISRSAPVR